MCGVICGELFCYCIVASVLEPVWHVSNNGKETPFVRFVSDLMET